MKQIVLSTALMMVAWGVSMPASAQYRPDRPDFYDEGRRQLNREIERLNEKKPDHLLSVDETVLQWQEFVLGDGNCKVQFPGVPVAETDSLETKAGPLNVEGLVLDVGKVRLIASTLDYPTSTGPVDAETVLANVRERLLEALQTQPVEENPVEIETYSGKELIFQSDDRTVIIRIYWVKQRLYLLGTINEMPAGDSDKTEVISQFFNSFQVIQ